MYISIYIYIYIYYHCFLYFVHFICYSAAALRARRLSLVHLKPGVQLALGSKARQLALQTSALELSQAHRHVFVPRMRHENVVRSSNNKYGINNKINMQNI